MMRSMAFWVIVPFLGSYLGALRPAIAVADHPAGSVEFFESRIRPVLIEHCFECHSSDASSVGGSLWLDSSDAMREGGDSGPAVMPGDVDASLLISALNYESSEMPPSGKLPDATIDDFEAWVAAGAVDPRPAKPVPARRTVSAAGVPENNIDWQSARKFWSFQPIQSPTIPAMELVDAPELPLAQQSTDAFLHQRLAEAAITSNPPASPAVRLRRLAYDLTGLPPSLDLQTRWLADPSPRRWQRIVDAMLASPDFGQHWARHWLDVARYADSNGSDFNATFHDAWQYRDYVIATFQDDRPIDQFIAQQIAGDLMTATDPAERTDQIVATTFLNLGTKMLSERDKAKLEMDVVDDQIDTVGRALMGLTLGCARCHDHKFDPIPTSDYYALAGIFRSTRTLEGEIQKYVSHWPRVKLPTGGTAMAASEKPTDAIGDCPICIRGEVDNVGPVVPRGFLRICGEQGSQIATPMGSGRLELAAWLTDPNHPLVARVFVNRVWMH